MPMELQRYRPRYQSPDALVQRTSLQRWYTQASDPPSQSTSRGSSPDVSAVLAQSDVDVGPSYHTTPLRQTSAGLKAEPTPGPITTPEWIQSFQRSAQLAVTPLRVLGLHPTVAPPRTPQVTTPMRDTEMTMSTNSAVKLVERRSDTPLASLDRRRVKHNVKRPMFGTDFEHLARRRQALYLAEEENHLRALAECSAASAAAPATPTTGLRNHAADAAARSSGAGSAGRPEVERKVKSFVEVLKEKRARELASRKISASKPPSTVSAGATKTEVAGRATDELPSTKKAETEAAQRSLGDTGVDVTRDISVGVPESVLAQYLKVVSRAASNESCTGNEDKGNACESRLSCPRDNAAADGETLRVPGGQDESVAPLSAGSPTRRSARTTVVFPRSPRSLMDEEQRRDDDALKECETLLQTYVVVDKTHQGDPGSGGECCADNGTSMERIAEDVRTVSDAAEGSPPADQAPKPVGAPLLSIDQALGAADSLLAELEEFSQRKQRHLCNGGSTNGVGEKTRKNTHEQQVDDVVHAFGHWFTSSSRAIPLWMFHDDHRHRAGAEKPIDLSVLATSMAFLESPNLSMSPVEVQRHVIAEMVALRDDVVNAVLHSLVDDTVADLVEMTLC